VDVGPELAELVDVNAAVGDGFGAVIHQQDKAGSEENDANQTKKRTDHDGSRVPKDRSVQQKRGCGSRYLSRQAVKEYTEWMYTHKKVTHNLDADQLIDMSYVDYANGVLRNTTSSG
jgi:hypothetical protein